MTRAEAKAYRKKVVQGEQVEKLGLEVLKLFLKLCCGHFSDL
jgi:hypothetical protein